ncbi:DUF917 domain-containing protein [Alicyclobacillus macrosporangiidus]|uniref:DUF917 domain-containing protein n=1 Tax=Alicyclobacillus macrosporangiidus TaxID=392015 RepID=UPI0004962A4B|nr:DUF917 domain-containing protein [Alicyclobacillus macrosporangiidus]
MTWSLTEDEVRSIAIGAGVLGTGGGGDPYLSQLQLIELLRQGKTVKVIPAHQLPEDAVGCGVSGMGAPTIGIEKLPVGDEMWQAAKALQDHLHVKFSFVVIGEIGGGNALEGLIAGAYSGLPVVDADPMGRAFPELQMDTFMIHGVSPSPFGLYDGHGNAAVLHVQDARTAERYGRALTIAMGGSSSLALPVVTGRQVKAYAIHGTLSLSLRIGQAIRDAVASKRDVLEAVSRVLPLKHLFFGKVVDIERKTTGGFARGRMVLEGLGAFSGSEFHVDIQNEFLIGWLDGRPVATVPDLISVLDADSGLPVGTESLKYGLRLNVIGIPASRKLKTARALEVVGPRAFGYDVDFQPLLGDLPEAEWAV